MLCEEFPALTPTGALRELARTPYGWLFEIIEARHYARRKATFDGNDAVAMKRWMHDELMDYVKVISFEQVRQERTEDG